VSGALLQALLGELTALPRLLAGFKGPTSREGNGRGWEVGRERKGEMKERGWRKGANPGYAHAI